MNCNTCIFWDSEHSWIEEIPLDLQFVADCEESRVAHCRAHSPTTTIVPADTPNGFKILSLFPATVHNTLCGEWVEDESRVNGSKTNDKEESKASRQ